MDLCSHMLTLDKTCIELDLSKSLDMRKSPRKSPEKGDALAHAPTLASVTRNRAKADTYHETFVLFYQ